MYILVSSRDDVCDDVTQLNWVKILQNEAKKRKKKKQKREDTQMWKFNSAFIFNSQCEST